MQDVHEKPAVESFRLELTNAVPMLAGGRDAMAALESVISERLVSCQRLLRWAIVQVSGNTCTIEGAYLKAPRQ